MALPNGAPRSEPNIGVQDGILKLASNCFVCDRHEVTRKEANIVGGSKIQLSALLRSVEMCLDQIRADARHNERELEWRVHGYVTAVGDDGLPSHPSLLEEL